MKHVAKVIGATWLLACSWENYRNRWLWH